MRQYTMVVSKKEADASGKNVYKEVGKVAVCYPLLSELGLPVEPAKWEAADKDGKMVACEPDSIDAMPVYADDKVQFVFEAVWAAVKAMARNRLESGTANLKDGLKIAETVEELLEAGGGRSGEALAARREFFAALKTYLGTLGKSAAYVAGMYDIISNVKNIPYQSPARKSAVKTIIEGYVAQASAEALSKYEKVIQSILDAAEAADPLSE